MRRWKLSLLAAATTSAMTTAGCQSDADKPIPTPTTATASASMKPQKVEIIEVQPSGESMQARVLREQERAFEEGRDLLIYVGAEWCEPCKRFHDAAVRGDLDAVFPTLRLLEFDRDRDEEQLRKAGCITKLIPLFARPNSAGGCDLERSMTGSVKGPAAIGNITPRLQALLAK